MYWTFDNETQKDVEIHSALSRDSGRSWSKPRSTRVAGQINAVCELADNRLLMFYVHRHAPASLCVRLSTDHGETWNASDEFVVYSKKQDQNTESTGAESTVYFQEMVAWTFGWPNAIPLPNGEVMLCYYAGDGNCSAVHVARLRL
jgi:hypothetical protein